MVAPEHTTAFDTCQGSKGTLPIAQRRRFFYDIVLPSEGLAIFWDMRKKN